ncbi:3-hydroxyacyl-ACP dehydratase [Parapedobacter tibetensis]|uniref:3-hydroxyacyl-ACP dehydratase n=1 Tax=Parapedobacter tibetensis TaxID=2972951 RepID=UPI00214DB93F|nr:3-hydroxyacyl-ACP dehydratase [Parapedobacter tibetensis]
MNLVSSQEAILKLIPQQPPFVLVDKILVHEKTLIISAFKIPENHVLVNKDGMLTEAGIIENFAQSIALYQGYDYFKRNLPPPVGYIGSIKNFEIYDLPRVGDELHTSVHILQQLFGVTIVRGEVKLNEKTIAIGEMRTVIAKDLE